MDGEAEANLFRVEDYFWRIHSSLVLYGM